MYIVVRSIIIIVHTADSSLQISLLCQFGCDRSARGLDNSEILTANWVISNHHKCIYVYNVKYILFVVGKIFCVADT